MTELDAMRRALELARRGWGRVHPNPMVGAVLLREGEVVGEGWHAEYGGPHAERVALDAAGARAAGATMVVTLEPCAHTGKQPPCADALLAAGVARVVAAVPDPNPVSAGGADRLRAAGLSVELGLLSCEAQRQNAAFFHQARRPGRPWVALKLATSIDHRIADVSGQSRWISGPEARAFVHGLRVGFAALAVGGHTALRDNPALTARGAITPRVAPVRILFEGSEPLPASLTALQTAAEVRTIVVTRAANASNTRRRLHDTAVLVVVADTLYTALLELGFLGFESLLVEGGGRLAGALLREGLVDRLYLIQSPLWLGDGGRPATAGWDVGALGQAPRWSVVERRALGEDTLLVWDREPCSPVS